MKKNKNTFIPSEKYTFDNFVVFKGNRIACALAKALSDNTAQNHYDVTLFCGESGVGKTHLLSAIYNRFTKENPTDKAVYFCAEQFVENFIDLIRSNKPLNFERYLSYDLLLIDNLELLSEKEATIHYLMKIICELKNHGKRVVLASSQHPQKFSCYEHDRNKLIVAMVMVESPSDEQDKIALTKSIAMKYGARLTDDEYREIALQCENSWYISCAIKSRIIEKHSDRRFTNKPK